MTTTISDGRAGPCGWCGHIPRADGGCSCRPCLACGGPLANTDEILHDGCDDDLPDIDPDRDWIPVRRIEDVQVKEGIL